MRVLRRKLVRDMRRQRAQYGAVVITIFLGVTLFGASFDAYRNLKASYAEAFTRYHFANLTVSGGSTARIARLAAGTPGVQSVSTRTQTDLPIQIGKSKLLGRVVGMPRGVQPGVNRVEVTSGRYLPASGFDVALADRHLADYFKLAPGGKVLVRGSAGAVTLTVAGVATSPEYFWPARNRQQILVSASDFGVLYVPERTARRLAGVVGPNQVAIYYQGGRDDTALDGRLTRLVESAGARAVVTREQQPSNSALQEDVSGFGELAFMFPLLFLTAAALAATVLLNRLVTAQRPIVGMLRASGFSRRQVLAHYVGFGVVTGTAGSVAGAIAGVLLAGEITHLYTRALSIPVVVSGVSPLTPMLGIAFGLV
ncbi:MAG: ABC transporter permease, partial [Thermoleophilia bacterium]|nr:ABC transporter permease [Thermoleophilia bacterium]